MKRYVLLCLLLLSGHVYAGTKPLVFVSILPQKFFIEQVSQGLVEVEVMVGPGQNPTTYEPTPRKISALARADIYFSIGVPFENAWLNRISSNYPQMKVVQCCDDIIDMSALHADAEHAEHQADDPHVWTSPNNVIAIARRIGQELSGLDSKNTDRYAQSTADFIQRLSELDQQIGKLTQDLSKRKLIVSHPAWSFYAAEYGFEQISIEQNGKDIQASSLRNLIRQARQDNIKAVFTQPQYNDKAARIIATELGGKVYSLDPLAYDYIENMLITTRLIVDGLTDE